MITGTAFNNPHSSSQACAPNNYFDKATIDYVKSIAQVIGNLCILLKSTWMNPSSLRFEMLNGASVP